jgi:adenosine deaminase
VFAAARGAGLRAVAHAGEEGPPAYITEALDLLKVVRIDHGVRCVEDDAVVARLVAEQVPLTVCPLSNVKLCVFPDMTKHNLATLLARGLRVTVNSDDPAYFGGYMLDNYRAICEALPLGPAEVLQLASNAVTSSWLPAARQGELLGAIRALA